jgi:hypothetical protein
MTPARQAPMRWSPQMVHQTLTNNEENRVESIHYGHAYFLSKD